MADSWEDNVEVDQTPPPPPPRQAGLNPNAISFNFNPNARTFAPVNFGPPPPPPPAAPAEPPAAAAPPPPSPVVDTPPPPATPPVNEAPPVTVDAAEEQSPAPPAPSNGDAVAEVTAKVEQVELDDTPLDEKELHDAVAKLNAEDGRDHINIVFIGHVDAGKSTLAGQILFLTGGVDQRTIEKYEREAKDKNREGWYMAYIMDTNEEERVKGITVEVGRAQFETEKRRYTILDAPGHKNYVPNMIMGASQADVAVLVISSRKGEFETGFEKGGQTREHAQLAKTLGVYKLIVVVNKLDDPTVVLPGGEWDQKRYDDIVKGLTPFFKSCGYNTKKDVVFLPIAALYGKFIRERADPKEVPWYTGPTLFEVLDGIDVPERSPTAPFRMPIQDKYRDMGTIIMGKSEAGIVRVGSVLQIMPNRVKVKVDAIWRDDKETWGAKAGENLRLKVTGADEGDISPGFVLSDIKSPIACVTTFEAQIQILDLLEHNPIFTVGYKSVLHIHAVVEECEVTKLIAEVDKKTGEQKKTKYIKSGSVCICRITVEKAICIDTFSELPSLGRFTLRDEGKTIAIGKVIKLPKSRA